MKYMTMVFIIMFFFLCSCSNGKMWRGNDGTYCLQDVDLYCGKKFVVGNDIIRFQNFELEDSLEVHLFDSVFSDKRMSQCQVLGFRPENGVVRYYSAKERYNINDDFKTKMFLKLDTANILKHKNRDIVINLHDACSWMSEYGKKGYDWSQPLKDRYRSDFVIYSLGDINYSKDFKTHIVAVLKPHSGFNDVYVSKYLLLINIKDGIVRSVVEIGAHAFGVVLDSKRKGRFFYAKRVYEISDFFVCFNTRREMIKKKKTSPPREIAISKFYFDKNGYLRFVDSDND